MIFNQNKQTIFRCVDCQTIVFVEFDNEEDIKKLNENKIVLKCACGGESIILRN